MRLALACLVLGVVLMVFFEATLTRIAGVAALFAFIVTGVFAIADPAFLGQEDDAGGGDEATPS
jgi:hypothetical protein